MIKAVFYKRKNSYYSFEISGHSGYAERGYDIVCASVSALSLHTSRILSEEFEMTDSFEQNEKGWLRLKMKDTNEMSDMLIKKLIETLRDIQEEYSGYLLVEVKE